MHVVARIYQGTEMADLLLQHKDEVEKIIREVPGFLSYNVTKLIDSTRSVTICETKEGCDKSVEVAREWLKANAPNLDFGQVKVDEGEVVFRFMK